MAGEVTFIQAKQVWQACDNWQDVSCDQLAMEEFLGIRVVDISGKHMNWLVVSPETARRIQLITSPNYKAIIKAYLIQQGMI